MSWEDSRSPARAAGHCGGHSALEAEHRAGAWGTESTSESAGKRRASFSDGRMDGRTELQSTGTSANTQPAVTYRYFT